MQIRFSRFIPFPLLLLLMWVPFMCADNATGAGSSVQTCANPIMYGWVHDAQLSDLSPTRDRTPYDLLRHRRLGEAALGLQRELAQHPDSLSAYVGLMQADPERWSDEVKRLQVEIAQQRASRQNPEPDDLFKLGTLLYYQWGQQPSPPRNQQPLTEAQKLLAEAWHRNPVPIIGILLSETLSITRASSEPALKGLDTVTINHKLIKELAGSRVYAQYLRAQNSVWNMEAPAVSLVPTQNLRPLLAVVANLRGIYGGRSGILRVIDGKTRMIDNPVPASQLAHERYLKEWYDNLVAALNT